MIIFTMCTQSHPTSHLINYFANVYIYFTMYINLLLTDLRERLLFRGSHRVESQVKEHERSDYQRTFQEI